MQDLEELVHLKVPHLFWVLNLLDYKPQAKNTAEGADVFPSLPSSQQQESDLEASLDHCATQPSPYPLGSWVCLQPRPVQKLAEALSPDTQWNSRSAKSFRAFHSCALHQAWR